MSKLYLDLVKRSAPKVLCIGKNYLKHVQEMGGTEVPKEPLLFMKPWSSVVYNPTTLHLPVAKDHRLDHELELGVFITKGGSNIPKDKVMDHVGGYFLALDLTDRDFQQVAKNKGFPWTLAKGQDGFCPVSGFIPKEIDPYAVELHLKVNGQTRQQDVTGNMHFKIDDMISYTSQFISLAEGDLFLTGTPNGVGPIKIGDRIQATASITGKVLASFDFNVAE